MAVAFAIILPGSIGTYFDLTKGVADWLNRDDITEERCRNFVALAEASFNRVLRVPDMETGRASLVATEKSTLPDDFLQMRTLYVEGAPDRPLRATSPNALPQEFAGQAGFPLAYAIAGSELRLAPPPASPVTLSLDYWRRIPSLGPSQPTNWLLDRHPDIYLYGVLVQAAAYIDSPDEVARWDAALSRSIAELQEAGRRARWGSGPIAPNTVVQVRGARC